MWQSYLGMKFYGLQEEQRQARPSKYSHRECSHSEYSHGEYSRSEYLQEEERQACPDSPQPQP